MVTRNYFDELINSPSYNLKNIYRYSNCHFMNQESTAEHTMLMQLMAIHVYNKLENPEFDLKELIYRIVIHDLDECVLCDIPRDIKYHDNDSLKLINAVANELLGESGFKPEFIDQINNAKHDHLEGELTGFFDVIQAVAKLFLEYKLQRTNSIKLRLLEATCNLTTRMRSLEYVTKGGELDKYLNQLVTDTVSMVQGEINA